MLPSSQYDNFISTVAMVMMVDFFLSSAGVAWNNVGKLVSHLGHYQCFFNFSSPLFFAFLGIGVILTLLRGRPSEWCSILEEKTKKSGSKCVKIHGNGSRLLLILIVFTTIMMSTPTCIKAESGGSGGDGSDVEEAPFVEMPDALKTLTKLSRDIHLRGSDPAVTMTTVQNIVQKHLESIEALQKMYQNGDNDGIRSVVETLLSDKETLKLAISQTKEISGGDPLLFGGEDIPLDSIVEEITKGDIEIDFVEAFRQSGFNSLVDDMKHISEILNDVDLSDLSQHSSHSHRRMTDYDLPRHRTRSHDDNIGSNDDESIFKTKKSSQSTANPNTYSKYVKLFENTGSIFPSGRGRGKATLPHVHHMRHGSADDRAARQLRVNDRNIRRRLAVDHCTPDCPIDDPTCNCGRLYECLKELSTYDLAVLTLRGYIITDGTGIGDITNDLVDVFDLGNGGLTKKFDFAKEKASMADPEDHEQCTRVLEELHSSCSATELSCSATNDQAYQLSVDEVCAAVDTNVKLNLETIFDVFSNKLTCLRITTSTTPCFEVDPNDEYRIKLATCDSWNAYQQFYMTPEGLVKVTAEPSKCLDQRLDGESKLYMGDCHGRNNQRWTYDSKTESLRSSHDGACADYDYNSGYLTHFTCHGQNNQKFSPIGSTPAPFFLSKWNSNGYLKAYVNFGSGYELVADSSFRYGEVVLDECYPAILGVKVTQGDHTDTGTDTWVGNIEVSNDGENFLPMKCTHGCWCDEDKGCSPLMPVAVDEDWDSLASGATKRLTNVYCHGNSNTNCTFAPDSTVEESGNGQYCKSAGFSACAEFVRLFSLLYKYRDVEEYPHGNPMTQEREGILEGTPLVADTCSGIWNSQELTGECIGFLDDESHPSYSVRCCSGSIANDDLTCSWKDCEYASSVDEAKNLCSAIGMRLCTKEDILHNEDNGRLLCCNTMYGCGTNVEQKSWLGETCENQLERIEEPKKLLQLTLHGVNSIDSSVVGKPFTVYNGCSSDFPGKCSDGYGNTYSSVIFIDKSVNDANSCLSSCNRLPFTENQVGFQIGERCECLYNEGDVPLASDITSLGVQDFWIEPSPSRGSGPVSGGDDTPGYHCHLSAAQSFKSSRETVSTCDITMAMLLGQFTSIGRLAGIVREIMDNGPSYMPGKCCLDKPTTSSTHFGSRYDPSRMTCSKLGNWHLGVSREACENVGGIWTRSPCLTLKKCIDNRPGPEDEGFSITFEEFASKLIIDDPADEERCGEVRSKLGFDKDFTFDTEVCDEFNVYSCDAFFDGIDDDRNADSPMFDDIDYEPPTYPEDPELTITPLPTKPTLKKVDDSDRKQAKDNLEISKVYMQYSLLMTRVLDKMGKDINSSLCNVGPWFVQAGCWVVFAILYPLTIIGIIGLVVATEAVTLAFVIVKNELINYAKINHQNHLVETKWGYDSLNILNQNVQSVNTQMMGILQERHTNMEININTYTMCAVNYLGTQLVLAIDPGASVDDPSPECSSLLGVSRRLELEDEEDDREGPRGPHFPSMVVNWSNNTGNGLLSNVTGLVEKAKNIVVSTYDRVEKIEGNVEMIATKLGVELPTNVGKADKEPASRGRKRTSNRLLQLKTDYLDDATQTLNEKLEHVNEKIDRMEERVTSMDKKLDRLVELVSTMTMLEEGEKEKAAASN